MGQIPSTLYGNPFDTYVSSKYDCIGNNGDSYYDKLIGGVDCNPVELSKTVIIQYLLSKYDPSTGEGLDCIYNQRPFVGVDDPNYNTEDQLNTTNYLQLFTGYLNTLCKKQTSISKITINTIPMGIEPFYLASDGTVEYSTDGITYTTNDVEVTGGETIYLRAAGSDCTQCGQSAYELYLDTVPEGETPLNLDDWLASLEGPEGPQGPAGTNANIAGLTWRGTWSANPTPTAYAVNDAVQYDGTSYVKIGTGGNASLPPDDLANLDISWELLALEGAPGPTGADGADGVDGATGVNTVRRTTANTTMLSSSVATDKGAVVVIDATAAATFTIPVDLNTTYYETKFQTSVVQGGSGQVQIVPDTGVTLHSANNMRYLRTKYSACTIIRLPFDLATGNATTNTYIMFGDLTNVPAT
jgi:hypothetical protein